MLITIERLKELLDYEPTTGIFRWKVKRVYIPAGSIAGYLNREGYRVIVVDKVRYQAHRLAWFYFYGRWPEEQVDHINRQKDANEISNLREATNAQNTVNRAAHRTSRSGFKGVTMHRRRWRAKIKVSGREIHIGRFDSPEEASAAYQAVAHYYFGEFAYAEGTCAPTISPNSSGSRPGCTNIDDSGWEVA